MCPFQHHRTITTFYNRLRQTPADLSISSEHRCDVWSPAPFPSVPVANSESSSPFFLCVCVFAYFRLPRPAPRGKRQPHGVRGQFAPVQSAFPDLPDFWPAHGAQEHCEDDLHQQIRGEDSICKGLAFFCLFWYILHGNVPSPGRSASCSLHTQTLQSQILWVEVIIVRSWTQRYVIFRHYAQNNPESLNI